MKKIFAALVLLVVAGCQTGDAIPQTKITEETHLRVVKVKPDSILVVEILGRSQEWPNVKNCDDYDVMHIEHRQRRYSAGRSAYWKDVEVFYLKPKRSFTIDWRYKGIGNESLWYHTEIKIE